MTKKKKEKVYKRVSLRVPDGGSVDQKDALGVQPVNFASKVPEQI